MDPLSEEYIARFDGLGRLYGRDALPRLAGLHVAVVGLGGVGSWAAEALARSGVGRLTLIDGDSVTIGNINRQLPALSSTLGEKKHTVLTRRLRDINPECRIHTVDDFLTMDNLATLLQPEPPLDGVLDAIDGIRHKAALINGCRRRHLPVVTTGGAGGLRDPAAITVADLSRTHHDPLASKVRRRLRDEHGFSRNPRRRFGVECVFSTEQPIHPRADGTTGPEKPGVPGLHLDCHMGYGAACFVTAPFGFVAAGRILDRLLK
ncbi:MAG: tRNA threonylcarbamoyladenosine dehydratase [Pseudomonadota bacterium]